MSGSKTFSHITVSSDEEEDFVIEAGVRSGAPFDGTFDDEGEDGEEVCALDAGVCVDVDGAEQSTRLEERKQPQQPKGRPSSVHAATDGGKADLYRETTMEDLEAEPMSNMQKAIVVVALLGIVAAVVYYFVFMH